MPPISGKKQRNIINYNLGQTMASAGSSAGFMVSLVAAIYYWYAQQGILWEPPLIKPSLFILALSLIGVAIAAPLRHFVVERFFSVASAYLAISGDYSLESKLFDR